MCFFNKHFSFWQRYVFHKCSKNNLWSLLAAVKYETLNSIGHCFCCSQMWIKGKGCLIVVFSRNRRRFVLRYTLYPKNKWLTCGLNIANCHFKRWNLKKNILNLNILSAANKVSYDFKLDLGKHTGDYSLDAELCISNVVVGGWFCWHRRYQWVVVEVKGK